MLKMMKIHENIHYVSHIFIINYVNITFCITYNVYHQNDIFKV